MNQNAFFIIHEIAISISNTIENFNLIVNTFNTPIIVAIDEAILDVGEMLLKCF